MFSKVKKYHFFCQDSYNWLPWIIHEVSGLSCDMDLWIESNGSFLSIVTSKCLSLLKYLIADSVTFMVTGLCDERRNDI